MTDAPDSTSIVYTFLMIVGRLYPGGHRMHRDVESLSPSEKAVAARQFFAEAGEMDNDPVGRGLTMSTIERVVRQARGS
ncbi:hypothetical protein [Pseudolysinimonas yzui]|uniref:Uncharacterized protein n=1 Tax=Pseudolysinimonas yzui TaxID=2708254 RepID=A0A8J3GNM9_9MICO|nr:hypothetical protein [Pseudolysinimonas yzui]GHF07873.1 hypothetical protein GCM10011600_05780 [Pseudolysinimonas yzui]